MPPFVTEPADVREITRAIRGRVAHPLDADPVGGAWGVPLSHGSWLETPLERRSGTGVERVDDGREKTPRPA